MTGPVLYHIQTLTQEVSSDLMPSMMVTLFLIVLLSSPVRAASVINEVEIRSNTGGNRVEGQENATIETGSTTTSVSISTNDSQAESNTNQLKQTNKVQVSVSGEGSSSVSIRDNGTVFSLERNNGQAVIKTTTNGVTEEKVIESREEIFVVLDEKQIKIAPSGEDYVIFDRNTKTYTTNQIEVIGGQILNLKAGENSAKVEILPADILSSLESQGVILTPDSLLRLQLEDGEARYHLTAERQVRVLGLFGMNLSQELSVSATTGETIESSPVSTRDRILSWFAR